MDRMHSRRPTAPRLFVASALLAAVMVATPAASIELPPELEFACVDRQADVIYAESADDCQSDEILRTLPDDGPTTWCADHLGRLKEASGSSSCRSRETAITVPTDGPVFVCADNVQGGRTLPRGELRTVSDLSECDRHETALVTPAAPEGVDDAYTIDEDTRLVVPAKGVLDNDVDFTGDPLAANLVSGPAAGTLDLAADGGFQFDPRGSFDGLDADETATTTFTYAADDGELTSGPTTVTITVTGRNDRPVAVGDTFVTDEDTRLLVAAPGVLGNDADAEDHPLAAKLLEAPSAGAVTLDPDGTVRFDPGDDFQHLGAPANGNGRATFTYVTRDGSAVSDTATVTVEVIGINDAPVGSPDTFRTDENTPLTIPTAELLANDTDAEGQPLTVEGVQFPTPGNGTLTQAPDGTLHFDPTADTADDDSDPDFDHLQTGQTATVELTYRADDGGLASAPVTVTITVEGISAPTANDDTVATDEDHAVALDLFANDQVEGGSLALDLGDTRGAATVEDVGVVRYDPAGAFDDLPDGTTDTDTFDYTLTNEEGSSTGSVTIAVTGVNDPPVAVDDSYVLSPDQPFSVPGDTAHDASSCSSSPCDVLANDPDPDTAHADLTAHLVSPPDRGRLTLRPDGGFEFDPAGEFPDGGETTFTYRAADGSAESAPAVVTLVVDQDAEPRNRLPVLRDATFTAATTQPPGTLVGTLTASDPDGDTLTYSLDTATTEFALDATTGELTIGPDGPPPAGTHTLTATVDDGRGGTDTATITVDVETNTEPVLDDASFTVLNTAAPGTLVGTLSATDADGDTLTHAVVAATTPAFELDPTSADLTVGPDGPPVVGTYTLTVRVDDGRNGTADATVTIEVIREVVAADVAHTAVGNTQLVGGTPPAGTFDDRAAVRVTGLVADPDGDTSAKPTEGRLGTDAGGEVTIFEDGTFVYEPPTADPNDPDGWDGESPLTDTFEYTLVGPGVDPDDATGVVTVELLPAVWYVDNAVAGPGTGTSWDPYATVAPLSGSSDRDLPEQTIFLYGHTDDPGTSDNEAVHTGALQLETGQRLLGHAAGLRVGSVDVALPGPRPQLNSPGDDASVTAASETLLTAFDVGGNGPGIAMTDVANVTIDDVDIQRVAGTGIDASDAVNVDIRNVDVLQAGGDGIVLSLTSGVTLEAVLVDQAETTGITATGSGGLVLNGVTVTSSGATGLHLADLDGRTTITGSRVDGARGTQLQVEDGAPSSTGVQDAVVIDSSVFTGSGDEHDSIDVLATSDADGRAADLLFRVTGATPSGSLGGDVGLDARARDGATLDVDLSRFTVVDTASDGIRLDAAGDGTTLTFALATMDSTGGGGIRFVDGAGVRAVGDGTASIGGSMSAVDVASTRGSGIVLDQVTGVTMDVVGVQATDLHGVALTGASAVTMDQVQVERPLQHGLFAFDVTNLVVDDSRFDMRPVPSEIECSDPSPDFDGDGVPDAPGWCDPLFSAVWIRHLGGTGNAVTDTTVRGSTGNQVVVLQGRQVSVLQDETVPTDVPTTATIQLSGLTAIETALDPDTDDDTVTWGDAATVIAGQDANLTVDMAGNASTVDESLRLVAELGGHLAVAGGHPIESDDQDQPPPRDEEPSPFLPSPVLSAPPLPELPTATVEVLARDSGSTLDMDLAGLSVTQVDDGDATTPLPGPGLRVRAIEGGDIGAAELNGATITSVSEDPAVQVVDETIGAAVSDVLVSNTTVENTGGDGIHLEGRACVNLADNDTTDVGDPGFGYVLEDVGLRGYTQASVAEWLTANGNLGPPDNRLVSAPGASPCADHMFGAAGNTELVGGTPPAGSFTARAAAHVDGLTDPGQTVDAGTIATTAGGVVELFSDGSFVYQPPPADPHDPDAWNGQDPLADTFEFTLADTGEVQDVAIVLGDAVWYVDNLATFPGAGTTWAPFASVDSVSSGTTDDDLPGQTIFLFGHTDDPDTSEDESVHAGELVLEDDQRLVGHGAGLTADGIDIVEPGPVPQVDGPSGGAAVVAADGTSLEGLAVGGAAHGIVGDGTVDVTIDGADVREPDGVGIRLIDASGIAVRNVQVDDPGSHGIEITGASNDSTIEISDTLVSTTGGHGINVTGPACVLLADNDTTGVAHPGTGYVLNSLHLAGYRNADHADESVTAWLARTGNTGPPAPRLVSETVIGGCSR